MVGPPPPLLGRVAVRASSSMCPYQLLSLISVLLLLCQAGRIGAHRIPQQEGQRLADGPTGKNLNDEDDARLLNKNNHDRNRNLSYNHGIQPKLVGGVDLEEPMFPWFAVSAGSILCGASLVHDDIMISAGHCAEGLMSGVRLGGIERRGDDQDLYRVDKAVVYPYYQGDANPGDLSLVKLSRPVSGISPIEIEADETWPVPGRTMTVLGYGAMEEDGGISDIQQMITLDVVDYASCYNEYGNLIQNALMFCTRSDDNPPKDTCQGDSGGPLFDSVTGKLQGVVAFGLGCGRPGVPSVNTRLSAFRDWITDTICELSDVPPSSCGFPTDNRAEGAAPLPTPSPVTPTEQPVTPPTRAPAPPPTNQPVTPPTQAPVPPPTKAPVPPPTNQPNPPPTQAPIPRPTNMPVPPPTNMPVPSPTNMPVPPSTNMPVRQTLAPVPPPTTTPVPPPTNQPAPAPTPAPVTPTLSAAEEIPTLQPNPGVNGGPNQPVPPPAAPTVSPSPPTPAPTGLRAAVTPSAPELVTSVTNQRTESPTPSLLNNNKTNNNNALPGAIEDNIPDTSGAARISSITRIIPQSTMCNGAGTAALSGILTFTILLLLQS